MLKFRSCRVSERWALRRSRHRQPARRAAGWGVPDTVADLELCPLRLRRRPRARAGRAGGIDAGRAGARRVIRMSSAPARSPRVLYALHMRTIVHAHTRPTPGRASACAACAPGRLCSTGTGPTAPTVYARRAPAADRRLHCTRTNAHSRRLPHGPHDSPHRHPRAHHAHTLARHRPPAGGGPLSRRARRPRRCPCSSAPRGPRRTRRCSATPR